MTTWNHRRWIGAGCIALLAALSPAALPAAGEDLAARLRPYVKKVLFFESGWETPAYGKRDYRTHFIESLTRYLNWEIDLEMPAPGKRIDYEIEVVWRRADGSIEATQKKKTFIEADWTTPWTSWGYGRRSPGAWKPGAYTVEFRVGGQMLASGSFTVLSQAEAGVAPATMLAGSVPVCPGARLLSLEDLAPGSTMGHAELEVPGDKTFAFGWYRDQLQALGWKLDTALAADKEEGALKDKAKVWGLLNLTREGRSVTVLVPADGQSNPPHTRLDITLLDPLAGASVADLVARLPRLHAADHKMNQRLQAGEWALTVLSAKIEGRTITKKWPTGASYTFSAVTPKTYLLRVIVELERLNGKPIKKDFLVAAGVRDPAGNLYPCVGAGTDLGEYYNYTQGGNQSLLMPVTAKDKLEYVFALPLEAAAAEFIWPGFEPVPIDVTGN